ncbi:MAG: hypothetical protein ACRDOU_20820 [Streptosporangiaceae bacterium]
MKRAGSLTERRPVRIAVVIPAGPGDDIADTLASVLRYTDSSRVVVVVDDTSSATASYPELTPDVTVMRAGRAKPGTQGGLWVKTAPAYRWILDRYQPGMVLRLDADAVILGPGLEAAAEQAFRRNPGAGLLGAYRVGPDGGRRDFRPAARQLRAEIGPRGLRRPSLRAGLRRYVRLARRHGYVDGEHVLGCAFLLRAEAIRDIYLAGCFSRPWLEASRLGDDQIMSLLAVAAGHQIADFGGPADPLAVKWRGLPAHPSELLKQGKLVTHSVRSWGDLTERQIRGTFAAARALAGGAG